MGMLWPPGKRSSMRRIVVRPRVQPCLPCLGLHCLFGSRKPALISGCHYEYTSRGRLQVYRCTDVFLLLLLLLLLPFLKKNLISISELSTLYTKLSRSIILVRNVSHKCAHQSPPPARVQATGIRVIARSSTPFP